MDLKVKISEHEARLDFIQEELMADRSRLYVAKMNHAIDRAKAIQADIDALEKGVDRTQATILRLKEQLREQENTEDAVYLCQKMTPARLACDPEYFKKYIQNQPLIIIQKTSTNYVRVKDQNQEEWGLFPEEYRFDIQEKAAKAASG